MMMKVWLCTAGILLAIMTGCTAHHAGDLARISASRNDKEDVLFRLGTPSFAECKDGKETLYYSLLDKDGTRNLYFVLLEGDRVQAYGKAPEQAAADHSK